uniref:EF-hand domain-containing protein n=1 Tax=Arcella intermedia TaxID=1963864 RepID=A0A6B2LQ24_9EUKA
MTKEQHKELKDAFSIFDKNGDGSISREELKVVLEAIGQKPSDAELDRLIYEVDLNNNGEIDFEEFLQMMGNQSKPRDSEDDIKKAFKIFDPEGTGYIKADELALVLTNLGDALSSEEIEEILRNVVKVDGKIEFNSFVKLLLSE